MADDAARVALCGYPANDCALTRDMRRLEAALTAAEAERDQAREHAADALMAHGLAVESLRHVEAECKRDVAACEGHRRSLAALEAAARAYRAAWDARQGEDECIEARLALVEQKRRRELLDAIADLATPPGAGA